MCPLPFVANNRLVREKNFDPSSWHLRKIIRVFRRCQFFLMMAIYSPFWRRPTHFCPSLPETPNYILGHVSDNWGSSAYSIVPKFGYGTRSSLIPPTHTIRKFPKSDQILFRGATVPRTSRNDIFCQNTPWRCQHQAQKISLDTTTPLSLIRA